jgi:hypothetical protein
MKKFKIIALIVGFIASIITIINFGITLLDKPNSMRSEPKGFFNGIVDGTLSLPLVFFRGIPPYEKPSPKLYGYYGAFALGIFILMAINTAFLGYLSEKNKISEKLWGVISIIIVIWLFIYLAKLFLF